MQNYRFICTALALYITVASFAGHKRTHPDDQESSKSTKRARIEPAQHDLNRKMLAAARADQWEVVYDLLQLGANIETKDVDGWTPLHFAAKSGHPQATEILLKKGANTAALNNNTDAALHIAVRNNNCLAVEALLKAGACADGNPRQENYDTDCFWTPLHSAAANGCCQAITMLLAHNADMELTNDGIETPLKVAIRNNQIKAMVALLQGGCPVIPEILGEDPLQCAIIEENKDAISILLTYGADIEKFIDNEYGNALHSAAGWSKPTIIPYLLQLGSNINTVNMDGKTALDIAAEERNCDAMIALLEGGASPMPLDEALRVKKTPLEIYRTQQMKRKVFFNLPLGLSTVIKKHYISTTTQDGFTLPITADNGDTILHRLLSQQKDMNEVLILQILRHDHNRVLVGHKNMHGENALHVGAKNNPLLLIRLLDELLDGKTKKERAELLKATTPYGDTLFSLAKSVLRHREYVFKEDNWTPLMYKVRNKMFALTPELRQVLTQSLAICDDPAYVTDEYDSALSVAQCKEVKNMIREDIRQKRRAQVFAYLIDEHQQPKVLADLQLQFAGTYEPSQ